MQDSKLLQKIEQAARDRVTKLDLGAKELVTRYLDSSPLAELPPEIGQLTNLKTLYLNDIRLAELPPEIGQLTNLEALYLNRNRLAELPPEIGQLTNLEALYLNENLLTKLPPEIGQLANLARLSLAHNSLTGLPSEIGQLANLTLLDLSNNQLTEFPIEISQLSKLMVLDLIRNPLTELPPEIGQLTNLYGLYLRAAMLTVLPREIGQLTNLRGLVISRNNLATLPPEIGRLTNLRTFDVRHNPLPIPPEILEKKEEPATIINYYLQHQVGQKKPLNEAKMVLVGQAGVGKTSLVRRLMEDRFDPNENKTEGIDIRRWQAMVDDQETQLNVWDFGGQEVMHATHQFFLTRRSLYLLVLDARLGEEGNRVEYWLKIIQSFGGGSPIIIVGNKIDQQPLDIDRRGLQFKYPSIKALVETSCETGEGIEELRVVIAREVGALEHIYDQLLLTWFAVKLRLEQMERDYIPYPEYVRMCQAEGIIDELSQRTLIRFLHDLGVVLNFQDDPRLEDTNILNPEWVTNGVYKILNSNALFQSKGVLERETLSQILDSKEYPRDKHLFIIDMMRRFELCFDFEGFTDRKFLIPDLLSKEEPYTGEWGDTLAFQYHYNVLPGSIISRFIVRMNHYIHQNTYWRNGVVLGYQRNKALVKADTEDKKIFIWISGPERGRRTFLAIIRAEFDAIHKTIAKIEAEDKVPLPGHQEIVVDYQHLLNLEALGEASFIPEGLRERVDVKLLLNGIEPEVERRGRQESWMRGEKSERWSTPQSPQPAMITEAEAVTELTRIKARLDLNAQTYAKRVLWLYVSTLAAIWIALGILIWRLGWSKMEPWTYLIGFIGTLGGYAYFAITQRELSPKAIYDRIVGRKQKKNYQEFGFDLQRYERLVK
jgi:internalin A